MKAKTIEERFWANFVKGAEDECWLWTGGLKGKYGNCRYKGRCHTASRVSYELHYGVEVPRGKCVRHTCDNPPCVNPAHLQIGTQADNMRDMRERGRHRVIRALTPEQVLEVRSSERVYGMLIAHAQKMGVSTTTIWNIARGHSYRDVYAPNDNATNQGTPT